jgi:hypothetical protein
MSVALDRHELSDRAAGGFADHLHRVEAWVLDQCGHIRGHLAGVIAIRSTRVAPGAALVGQDDMVAHDELLDLRFPTRSQSCQPGHSLGND